MEAGALAPYEHALRAGAPLRLRSRSGELIELDLARWMGGPDVGDETVLARCRGPVLDVGCGPGRFVAALTARGVPALGVDIAEAAVALTRRQGHAALVRDVFTTLPGEGRWPTVLVMDGNVGIGGDPARLLGRLAALLAPGGRAIVETHPDHHRDARLRTHFADERGHPVGPEFPWAQVGLAALAAGAGAAGCAVAETWTVAGRPFAALRRA